jgi:hypothetical protein
MPRISTLDLRGVATRAVMAQACSSICIDTMMQDMDVSSRVMAAVAPPGRQPFLQMHAEHLPITATNWRHALLGTTLKSCWSNVLQKLVTDWN